MKPGPPEPVADHVDSFLSDLGAVVEGELLQPNDWILLEHDQPLVRELCVIGHLAASNPQGLELSAM